MATIEGKPKLAHITSLERIGFSRGIKQSRKEGLEEGRPAMMSSRVASLVEIFAFRFCTPSERFIQPFEAADTDQIN